MAKHQSSLLNTWLKSKKVPKSSQTVSNNETEDEAESRPTTLHAADSVRMPPIDLHMTNEGLVNEDECVVVIDEAEYMHNHDESKDETEFRSKSAAVMQYTAAQVHVSNKEDVIATEKDGCALVKEDLPSNHEEADLTGDCASVSEENQHRLAVSVDLDAKQKNTPGVKKM